MDSILEGVRRTRRYNELYDVIWKSLLGRKVKGSLKNLKIALFVNPCYGFGDIIFALKIYNYIHEWYGIRCTVYTTKPAAFVENGVRDVMCVKVPGKSYEECDDIRQMAVYEVKKDGKCGKREKQ